MHADPWTPDFPKPDIRAISCSVLRYDAFMTVAIPYLASDAFNFDFILTILDASIITPVHFLY